MQLKEKIQNAINKMPTEGLTLLYEQIKILENLKDKRRQKVKSSYTIHKIQNMTKSSKSSWSDSVIEDRKDRI